MKPSLPFSILSLSLPPLLSVSAPPSRELSMLMASSSATAALSLGHQVRGAMGTVSGTTTTTATGCTGEGCRTRETWPLHHVKHRGVFVRLCTACVLKYHPSLFCSLCHGLLIDSSSSPDLASISNFPSPTTSTNNVIHCSSCLNVCHSSCLPPSSTSASFDFFLCPSCSSSSAAATADALLSSRRKTLDLSAVRALHCTARIAANSMTRAAAAARADADRKAKEAAAARKRAREMIERVADVAKREKEKETGESGPEHDRTEKERGKPKGGLVGASAGGSREREKWMRLYEMPPTPFHEGEKTLPLPAAKFEHDDTKYMVAPLKPSTVLPNSLSKSDLSKTSHG